MTVSVEKIRLNVARLVLDPSRLAVQMALSNPWEMHRLVCQGDGVGHTEHGRALFRVETRPGAKPSVLVQTTNDVNWEPLLKTKSVESFQNKEFLPEDLEPGALLGFHVQAVPVTNKACSRLVKAEDRNAAMSEITAAGSAVDMASAGRIWSHHASHGARIGWEIETPGGGRVFVGKRGKKRQVSTVEENIHDWIGKRLRGGRFLGLTESAGVSVEMTKHSTTEHSSVKRGEFIRVFSRRLTGTVQVTDPHEFARMLARGIGTCRAFGFGLVSVRRWS